MDPKLAAELNLQFFHDHGMQRKTCPSCDDTFWTIDPQVTLCGDPPCVEYDFIGNPITKKPFDIPSMREEFLSFFETKDHTRVERFPVVARWREDIYLTIASIANFQPFVTSGIVPPPANPLVISQPCIRLNDLANVGKTGRHLTTFEMMGHHAFNNKEKGEHKYWTEECLQYADEFLVDRLGFARERMTYKEHIWSGGGNAGPAVEVLSGGLEVATLVFMNLEQKAKGEFEANGDRYDRMNLNIIDTGWGLERLAWASQGAPNAYEVTFPEALAFLNESTGLSADDRDERTLTIMQEHARVAGVMSLDLKNDLMRLRKEVARRLGDHGITTDADELQRLMAPWEDTYAVADHTRCLAFMLADGIVPSNAKAGYLARLMVRRTLRMMENIGARMPIKDMVVKQIEILESQFPDLMASKDRVEEILDLETRRYGETIDKGRRMVQRIAKKGQAISEAQLVELYDSHGLAPDIVKAAAEPLGAIVDVPAAFDAMVATMHEKEIKELESEGVADAADVPATRALYYEQPDARAFVGSVLWASDRRVVLDQTAFYPEGGGQEEDLGTLVIDGETYQVEDVQKDKLGHVFHYLDRGVSGPGLEVTGHVDWERRTAHMRHHTGTHILNGAARDVLGDHVWQQGAYKCADYARLDISHFKRLTQDEVDAIERRANEIVLSATTVDRRWMKREEAEKEYGHILYQGGVAPGRNIRIINIGGGIDVEACGGTHAGNTAEVGPIKIVGVERVQDGVERIVFRAGLAAVAESQRRDALLRDSAQAFSVQVDDLPKTSQRFFDEWKGLRKQVDSLKKKVQELSKGSFLDDAEKIGNVRVVRYLGDEDMKDLIALATEATANPGLVIVLGAGDSASGGRLVVARSADVDAVHAGKIIGEAAPVIGGKGGGKPTLAQGGGPDGSKAEAAVDAAVAAVKRALA